MADIKFTVEVDSKKGTARIKELGDTVENLGKKAKASVPKITGLWKSIAGGIIVSQIITKAWRTFTGVIKDAIDKSAIQEEAVNNLRAALESTGRPVEMLSKHFQEYASQLQKATIYGDEQVMQAQALLIQLTKLDREGLDAATRGALGLASVYKIDLKSATTLVAKALAGNYGALSRYGITVKDVASDEEKRAEILKQLEVLYKRAEAETDTFSGKLQQLRNVWGDMLEKIGDAITHNEAIIELMQEFKRVIEENADVWAQKFVKAIQDTAKTLKEIIPTLKTVIVEGFRGIKFWIDLIRTSSYKLQRQWLVFKGLFKDTSKELLKLDREFHGLSYTIKGYDVKLEDLAKTTKDTSEKNKILTKSFLPLSQNIEITGDNAKKAGEKIKTAFEVFGVKSVEKMRKETEELKKACLKLWEEYKTGNVLTEDMEKAINKVIEAYRELGIEAPKDILKIKKSFYEVIPSVRDFSDVLEQLPPVTEEVTEKMEKSFSNFLDFSRYSFSEWAGAISTIFDGIFGTQTGSLAMILTRFATGDWLGGLAIMLSDWKKFTQDIISVFENVIKVLTGLFENLFGWIGNVVSGFFDWLLGVQKYTLEEMQKAYKRWWEKYGKKYIEQWKESLGDIYDYVKKIKETWEKPWEMPFDEWEEFKKKLQEILNLINQIRRPGGIPTSPTSPGSPTTPSGPPRPGWQTGFIGWRTRPQLVKIAEKEPELHIAIPKSKIENFPKIGTTEINLVFNINAVDGADVIRVTREKIIPEIINILKVNYRGSKTQFKEALNLT